MTKKNYFSSLTLIFLLLNSCNATHIIKPEPVALDLGYRHTGVIDTNGHLWMFGYNLHGQIGNNQRAETSILEPINITRNFKLNNDEVITNIALGYGNTMATTSTNRLFTWGSNILGQIGDPEAAPYGSNTPVEISDHFELTENETIAQLAISHHADFTGTSVINKATLGFVSSVGRLFVWGYWPSGNQSTFLGTGINAGNYRYFSKPTEVSNYFNLNVGEYFTKIDLGEDYAFNNHMAFLTNQGRMFMIGDNFSNQIIYLKDQRMNYSQPIDVSTYLPLNPNEKIVDLSLGNRTTSATTNLNRVFLWGSNDNGNLANNHSSNFDFLNRSIVPIQFQTISAKRIEMSGENGFAISLEDYLYVWGDNKYGQLGLSSNINYSLDPRIHSGLGKISQFSGGDLHFGVINTNGELWVWGRVGDGPSSTTNRTPQKYVLGNI